jgi:hypothetical protein
MRIHPMFEFAWDITKAEKEHEIKRRKALVAALLIIFM